MEEQETVISLQAKFGNKWAKIATFLEGRTDNDVKNFWSTRKKKIARMQKKTSMLGKKKNNVQMPLVLQVMQLSFLFFFHSFIHLFNLRPCYLIYIHVTSTCFRKENAAKPRPRRFIETAPVTPPPK